MRGLSAQDILFIHSAIIDEIGGTHGVRDLGIIESAVERPLQTFGGVELYPSLMLKAAALFHSIANFHAFVDGNKRTGIVAAALLLERNGIILTASNRALEQFTLRAIRQRFLVKDIAEWFVAHSQLLETPLR